MLTRYLVTVSGWRENGPVRRMYEVLTHSRDRVERIAHENAAREEIYPVVTCEVKECGHVEYGL